MGFFEMKLDVVKVFEPMTILGHGQGFFSYTATHKHEVVERFIILEGFDLELKSVVVCGEEQLAVNAIPMGAIHEIRWRLILPLMEPGDKLSFTVTNPHKEARVCAFKVKLRADEPFNKEQKQ